MSDTLELLFGVCAMAFLFGVSLLVGDGTLSPSAAAVFTALAVLLLCLIPQLTNTQSR